MVMSWSHVAVQSGLGLRCWECLADCGDVTNHQEEQCDQDVEYCLRWIVQIVYIV